MPQHAQLKSTRTKRLRRLKRFSYQLLLSALVSASPLLISCDDSAECEVVNTACSKDCDPGLTPICVATSICACVSDSMGGVGGALSGAEPGGTMGATTGATEPPPSCAPPPMGSLTLNEAMVNPSGPEPQTEFVELVNSSDQEVDLTGLSLQYEGKIKRLFSQGCMAPRSAAALFSDDALSEWSTPPRAVAFNQDEFRSFSFANSRDAVLRLIDASGATISELVVPAAQIEDGESATRSPDLTGEVLEHGLASPTGALSSPARCNNLGTFEMSCTDGQVPMGGTPMGGTPMGGTPMGGTPMGGTPVGGTPVSGTEAGTTPVLIGDPFGMRINELDYDQPSADTLEFIEIMNAGTTRTSLAGLQLELINGANNSAYEVINLGDAGDSLDPGTFAIVGSEALNLTLPLGIPVIQIPNSSIQNGPDGVRLTFQGQLIDEVGYKGYVMRQTARDDDSGSEQGLSLCTTSEGPRFVLAPPSPARDNECPAP